MSNLGHNVTLLTSQFKKFKFPYKLENREGVSIYSFPDIVPFKMRKGGLGVLNIFLKSIFVLTKKYDIVISDSGHRPSSGIPCVINRFFQKSLYISEWWDFFGTGGMKDEMPLWYRIILGNYDTWAEKHNKKIANGTIALSEFTKKRALELGIKEEKILVLNGGADVRSIKFIPDNKLKRKYNIPENTFTFAFVGMNDYEINDLEPFLLALKEYKGKLKINWFSTGKILSTSIKNKFNIGKELKEFGWIDYNEYSEVLSCADAFILIQRDNLKNKARWPNKIGDYLSAGRPILVNEIGDLKYYLNRFENAFIKVKYNKDSILEFLNSLENNVKKFEHNRKYVRLIAEEEMSWTKRAQKLEQFLYNLIKLK